MVEQVEKEKNMETSELRKKHNAEKLESLEDKGYLNLAEAIYAVWEDRYICVKIKEFLRHTVENNFDLFTLFSEPVPLNESITKTVGFKCDCGYNEFRSFKELASGHLTLVCYNCGKYHWF